MSSNDDDGAPQLVLVARKPCYGLPTACPVCLPVYCYLRFANVDFNLHLNTTYPDSDQIPYVEYGGYVAYNNENGGAIEYLKKDKIVDLDSQLSRDWYPDWLSMKAMISSWLADALQYELWVASDKSIAYNIYFSDLPWPIGNILHWNQTRKFKKLHGISNTNCIEKEEEIYRKASLVYDALSLKLGENVFLFGQRPTSLDALFLGHAVFILSVFPDSSVLKSNLLLHDNLVRYAEKFKIDLLKTSGESASGKVFASDATSSSTPGRKASASSSYKDKQKEKKTKTEQEKGFYRRAKYFLAAQAVSVVLFLTLMGVAEDTELEDNDDD